MAGRAIAGVVALLLLGNLAILAATAWARETTSKARITSIPGIDHLEAVDVKLWRGGAPSDAGYRALAAAGTTTVVDLRAEDGIEHDAALVESLGMNLVRIPIRDGQTPTTEQVTAFLQAAQQAPGPVFVHCGAGVGRTGTMVGAYLVATGELNGAAALRRNLAVGPPSLEQVAFVAGLEQGRLERPNPFVRGVSRVLDAPRRAWVRLGF